MIILKCNKVTNHLDRFLFLLIGWVGVILLTIQVAGAEVKSVTWDPYEILGISEVPKKNY